MKYIYNARIVNVVDGDTCDVLIDLGFNTFIKERVRLAFIDTKEINSKIETERILAQEAKKFLLQFNGKDVSLDSHGKDKYGRYVADLKIDVRSISQLLLDSGLAVKYE